MPRPVRLPTMPFGWYYAVLYSIASRRIVTSHADLMMVLKLLRETLRERGARLHAGYIAEREMHLVLQAGEGPLSAITGGFQHEYARLFNRSHHEHGSLFRLHHHILLFQHPMWLVPLVHYVHWIRRLDAPGDIADGLWWSSDAVYRGLAKQGWLTTNVVLRMLGRGAYDRQSQEEAYRKLFDRTPEPSHASLFRRGSAEDPRLLGDAQFMANVWRVTGRRLPYRTRRALDVEGEVPGFMVRAIERFYALCDERLPQPQARAWRRLVTYENLRSGLRKRPLPMLRALSVSYVVEQKMATVTQAARFFLCSPRSVSARRRRFYTALFREWFDAKPEILFGRERSDRSVGRKNDGQAKLDRAACRIVSQYAVRPVAPAVAGSASAAGERK